MRWMIVAALVLAAVVVAVLLLIYMGGWWQWWRRWWLLAPPDWTPHSQANQGGPSSRAALGPVSRSRHTPRAAAAPEGLRRPGARTQRLPWRHKKAPRVGLEPTTLRLTAGCSAN